MDYDILADETFPLWRRIGVDFWDIDFFGPSLTLRGQDKSGEVREVTVLISPEEHFVVSVNRALEALCIELKLMAAPSKANLNQ